MIDFTRFSDRYPTAGELDPDSEREARAKGQQETLARFKPALARSPFWRTKLTLPAQAGVIPVTIVLRIYDGADHDSPDPLRTLRDPAYLAWTVAGFFQVRTERVKWTMSAGLNDTPMRGEKGFVYFAFPGSKPLAPLLDYLALPLPLESASAELLLPGEKKWRDLGRPTWEALSEVEYRGALGAFRTTRVFEGFR